MVELLVVPDGAAQPLRAGRETALEAASTPVLDRLAAEGAVVRVITTAIGMPPGSQTGIAALLGAPQPRAVGRGWVDAAAYGLEVPAGLTPWRADVLDAGGSRATLTQTRAVCARLGAGAHAVGGHRVLMLAHDRPADQRLVGLELRVWPGGPPPVGRVPTPTTVICAAGAAAGCGRLLGAHVVVPSGATGDVDTDLRAKAAAAIAAGTGRIVVHVGGPDEAAHRRDSRAVVEALERMDAELLGPLRDAVERTGGRLAVCPDHGTDPATGEHDGAPVPAVVFGSGVGARGPRALSERAATRARLISAAELFAL